MIKILAIDDKRNNLVVLTALFSNAFPNARIITALSGREGIEKALTESPDVILLDLVMPIMDGIETCRILKEDDVLKWIPVIMITAKQTDSKTHTKALETGVEAFLSKPIDEAELTAQVSSMIRLKKSEDQIRQENKRFEELVHERTIALEESKCAALNLLEELTAEIEHRKLLDEALLHTEKDFRDFFNDAPVGLYRTTPDGKILLANRAIYKMLGFSTFDNLSARNLEESGFEPSYRREQFMKQIEKNGEVKDLEAKWICCNGEVIIVRESAKVIRDSNGKPLYYDGTVEDITERKRADEALRESEERFRSVAESANDAIVTANSKGIISGWNRGAEKIFGYKEEDIIGKGLTIIIPQRYVEQHLQGIKRIEQGGEHHVTGGTVELHGMHKSGKEFPLELSLAEWETSSRKFFTGIIRDCTRRKKEEKELLMAKDKAEESDRLKSAFLANMSHEIRTPLNAIVGFSGLFTDPALSLKDRENFAKIIKSRSDDLLHIINDILEISRIESGNAIVTKEQVVVNDILDELEVDFRQKLRQIKKTNLQLVCKKTLSVDESRIIIDGQIVKRVFSNLIDNAIKFTESGAIQFGYHMTDNHILTCYVSDTGIGISAENQEVIFENFRQAVMENPQKLYGGTGLGLSICKGSLALLGGKIWVESVPGEGSTFYFTIPFEQSPAQKTKPARKPDEIQEEAVYTWAGKKLLLVEDEESNMKFLKTILNQTQAESVCAVNGRELRNLFSALDTFDLVLLDIRLPDANGWELAKEIKAIRSDLPVIAQTAYAMPSDRQKSKEVGCDNYISKPIRKEQLLEMIAGYIEGK
ncbi:MAG: PAS domain S-box protein [bacterium]